MIVMSTSIIRTCEKDRDTEFTMPEWQVLGISLCFTPIHGRYYSLKTSLFKHLTLAPAQSCSVRPWCHAYTLVKMRIQASRDVNRVAGNVLENQLFCQFQNIVCKLVK